MYARIRSVRILGVGIVGADSPPPPPGAVRAPTDAAEPFFPAAADTGPVRRHRGSRRPPDPRARALRPELKNYSFQGGAGIIRRTVFP